jgi:hypothetical protein
MMMRLAALSLVLSVSGFARASEPTAEGLEFFEKRIRPILAENCYQCHSADKKIRGGLRLDSKTSLMKGGDTGPVVVAGQPDRSLLIKAINYKDDLKMPQRSKLPDQQIADLTAWVKMGAPMPPDRDTVAGASAFDLEKRRQHWSFQPIKRPTVPGVRSQESEVRNPIDAFLAAKRQAAGIEAAPEADRRTLIRRLTFDLTGLPPTPEEIRTFLEDQSIDAYEKVVDRLLASPAYGERWGRHWLDLVRYAETLGHEFDFDVPFAYQYRDYVVRALNADLPYDRFVTEQIAGDLLANPRRHAARGFNESIIGTGFYFLGEGKHSPVDIRAEGAERIDNQIDVLSKTFLGLTVSCARCHDHKFDAITTKDYYALAGYLRSSRFQLFDDRPAEPTQSIIKRMQEHLEKAQALGVEISAERLRATLAGIDGEDLQRVVKSFPELAKIPLNAKSDDFDARRRETIETLKKQQTAATSARVFADFTGPGLSGWIPSGEAFGDRACRATDVVVNAGAPLPAQKLLGPGGATSGRLGIRLVGALRSPSFTIDSKHILFRVAGRGMTINLIIDGFQQIRDPIYGGLTFNINHGDDLRWHVMNVSMWQGHRAYIECLDPNEGYLVLDRVLFSDGGPPPEAPNPAFLKLLEDDSIKSAGQFEGKLRGLLHEIIGQWREGKLDSLADGRARANIINQLLANQLLQKRGEEVADEQQKRRAIAEALQQRIYHESTLPLPFPVIAITDGTGENEHVFIRGNHKTLGDEAPRRFLEALGGKGQLTPKEGSGRLELARRMTDASNPLLPRVMVNRLWHHHFGTGIVRSPDDFGHQGQLPTHPELLDWLASEFVRQDWSLKAMHRLMVTSAAYRMSSHGDTKADEVDPENRLWHKYPVRRLEAEAIRDSILSVSGRLDRRMEGPGVMPNLTPHMQGRGRPGYSGPLDGDGRRSLYVNVRRNFLTPLFLAFDYPIPFTTIGRRSVSNVPAQALAMMNNPFVKQQAELWAKRILAKPGLSAKERVSLLYETAFGRLPAEDEMIAALDFLKEQRPMDDVRSWAELCHVLFNVKEFIFLN